MAPPGGWQPGALTITPGSADLGKVLLTDTAHVDFTATNDGDGGLAVTAITIANPDWALSGLPVIPQGMAPTDSFGFTLTFTPPGAGVSNVTISFTWTDHFGSHTTDVLVIAEGWGGTTALMVYLPANLGFGTTQVNTHPADLVTGIKNLDAVPHTITVLNPGSTGAFSFVTPPALPVVLAAGATQALTVRFQPTTVGLNTDSLSATTSLGAIDTPCAVQGVAVIVLSVAICVNRNYRLIVGGFDSTGLQGKPAPVKIEPDNLDSDQDCSLNFNGVLWEGLGAEKTLMRLGFYYENFGVANFTIQLDVYRPTLGVDSKDTYIFPVTLGSVLADGKTRYAEVDTVASGEIIYFKLIRLAASGPLSLSAIVPYFQPRGEKVRNV